MTVEFSLSIFETRRAVAFVAVCLLMAAVCYAQPGEPPPNVAPPPVRAMTKEERDQLKAAKSLGDQMKTVLVLLDARMDKAEARNQQSEYTEVLNELGGFQAVLNAFVKTLDTNDSSRGKVLETRRKFEISLRAFAPRIELVRREIPERFEYHVRQILKDLRETRGKIIEPLFTDKILSEPAGGGSR